MTKDYLCSLYLTYVLSSALKGKESKLDSRMVRLSVIQGPSTKCTHTQKISTRENGAVILNLPNAVTL